MDQSIDYLSVEDLGWVHFKTQLISFGHHGLPPDVHFTISYDSRSEDINFHLTRNVPTNENKPKIAIACINKELLNKLQIPIAETILGKLLLPLDIKFLRSKYGRRLYYLSFADLEQDSRKVDIEVKITNEFKKISAVKRRTRLKINSPTETVLKSMFLTAKMRNLLLDNLNRFPKQFSSTTGTGFLLTGKTIVPFIRIDQNWYRINDRMNPIDLFLAWIDTSTRKELVAKFTESISFIKTAETYKDTEPYDTPIRLVELLHPQTDFV
ncbi:hypothetical protein [Lacibacter sp.]|uniref:hypothetical protein n=1 Tax=Lacibacter sp. TaxID=1915409 RepID=UPI002B4B3BC8|nr:hypothetical protein [Lacibacter sp.]HLP38938.1 hypothetical protein [Lacibacter sp.]